MKQKSWAGWAAPRKSWPLKSSLPFTTSPTPNSQTSVEAFGRAIATTPGPQGWRGSCLRQVEALLVGLSPHDAALRITPEAVAPHLSPIDDIRATASYRAEAAATLLARAVGGFA